MDHAKLLDRRGLRKAKRLQEFTKKIHYYVMWPREPTNDKPSGLDISACQTRLVWANEREVEPQYQNSPTSATEHTVCWMVERGHVSVEDTGRNIVVRVGEWLFLRAAPSRQRISPRARLISIRFDLRYRGGSPLFLREKSRILPAAEYPLLEQAARSLVEALRPHREKDSLLVARGTIPLEDNFRIEAAYFQWLSAYMQAMRQTGARVNVMDRRDERITKALALIEDHPMRKKFLQTGLARSCGLSVSQLTRLFRQETGTLPHLYYDKRRLALARHALKETRRPVKEIAFELGFHSSPHFTNWFSDRENISPRAFRAKRDDSD